MAIIVRLDRVLADRKMSLGTLAAKTRISMTNLSLLKTGKVRAVRFSTLSAVCEALNCQPADLLEWVPGQEPEPEVPVAILPGVVIDLT